MDRRVPTHLAATAELNRAIGLSVQAVYDAMRLVGVDGYGDQTPIASILTDALCLPVYDGGNMGVRRRQLLELISRDSYDAMASAEGRVAG